MLVRWTSNGMLQPYLEIAQQATRKMAARHRTSPASTPITTYSTNSRSVFSMEVVDVGPTLQQRTGQKLYGVAGMYIMAGKASPPQ